MKLQKSYAIVLCITLSLILIVSLQTGAAQDTQTVKKELLAVKIDQTPTIDGVLNDACWHGFFHHLR